MGEPQQVERYVAFAFAAADLLLETDARGCIGFAAGAAQGFAGCEAEALVGRQLEELVRPADRTLVTVMLERVEPRVRVGPVLVGSAGDVGQARMAALSLGPEGAVRITLSDIGLSGLAGPGRDPATGLLDQERFAALAEQALAEPCAKGSAELSFFRFDGEGWARRLDASLPRVAAILRLASHGGEAVSQLSPGRFALLHEPGGRAARLEAELRAVPGCGELKVTRSTLRLHEAALSPQEASQALLFALGTFAAGGPEPGFRTLDEALARRLESTVQRIGEARRLIGQASFGLVFQPIVRLADRSLHHVEALARFADGREPAEFIPFLENVGLVAELDLVVVRMALATLGELRAGGGTVPIAVNISARSLESDSFLAALRRTCSGAGRLARQLLFEITETAGIRDLERAASVVGGLRQDGHQVCLDDFGAGAAAFHYLRALTVDYVKLDGAYTRGLLVNARDASILRTMVDLCASLRVRTIAEMIETEDQAGALAGLGIELGQGWLLGRPRASPIMAPQAGPQPRMARRQGAREQWC